MSRRHRILRSLVSLLIFIHLFLLTVAIFRNQVSSDLYRGIAKSIGIYTRTLGFDALTDVDFRLTHAARFEDNHHFEVYLPGQDEPIKLPDAMGTRTGEKGGMRYQRFRNFTRHAALAASLEDDTTLALYARSIGNRFLDTEQDSRMVLRLVSYSPQDWQTGGSIVYRDLHFEVHYDTLYEADVWLSQAGNVNVHKRVPVAEAAPLTTAPASDGTP